MEKRQSVKATAQVFAMCKKHTQQVHSFLLKSFSRFGKVILCILPILIVSLLFTHIHCVAYAAAPKLFGSVEFRGSMKNLKQWLNVQKRHYKSNILVSGSKLNSAMTFDQLKARLKGKDEMTQLKFVNNFWNRWPYKQDPQVYKAPDYWASPAEFKSKSGDCEDYAIAKYFTLRSLGFPMEKMRIVVVRDTILQLAHAVLAVYIGDEIYILDNLSKNVLPHTRIRNYIPHYSVNEKTRWMHVMPKKKK